MSLTVLRRPSAVAAVAVAVSSLGVALPASADDLSCGQVVTTSTVLTHDLVCGPGDGLIVGADDVVLNLGGHSITGAGAYGAGAGAGVRITGRSGVTVTNGEIGHFAAAVELQQSWGATISEVVAHHGDRGINVGTGGRHLLEKNVLHDNGRDAVLLHGTVDTVVSKNVLDRNVFGIGVANGARDTVVDKNVVNASRYWAIALYGWEVTGTVLTKNVVSRSAVDGIAVEAGSSATVLTKNEAYANGDDGIHVNSTGTTLTKNLAVSNGDLGIEAVPGVTDGGGNMAAGNGNPLQCTGVVCTAPQ